MTRSHVEFLATAFQITQRPDHLTAWADATQHLWDGPGHDPNGEQW